MRDTIDPRRVTGLTIVLAGVILLANPAWLATVSIYPGTGWGFLPLFHAAFTALGVVAIAAGVLSLRRTRGHPSDRELLLLSVGTVVAAPLYALVLATVVGTGGPAIDGYGYRQAFVASLVVAAFLGGCAVTSRRRSVVRLALAVPVLPLLFVLLDWRSGALLEPVLELHFLLTGNPTGVPYLGPLLFAAAFALGVWMGWQDPIVSYERGASASESGGSVPGLEE